jgi:hypothetical protein
MPYMVAVAKAGCERDAKSSVRSLGFSCYMPTYREKIVERGRRRWVERLLLGRYFFVRHVPSVDPLAIPRLRHVSELFMWYDRDGEPTVPALVRDAEVERIRAAEGPDGHVAGVLRELFTRGQPVRAVMGLMQGSVGTYDGPGRQGTLLARMDVLGRATRIEFPAGYLSAA